MVFRRGPQWARRDPGRPSGERAGPFAKIRRERSTPHHPRSRPVRTHGLRPRPRQGFRSSGDEPPRSPVPRPACPVRHVARLRGRRRRRPSGDRRRAPDVAPTGSRRRAAPGFVPPFAIPSRRARLPRRSTTCVPGSKEVSSMTVRVGINGFGRIGRQSLKALIERAPEVEVVAVNDLVDVKTNALLFKHDSTYGAYPGEVRHTDDSIVIDGREIKVLQVKDPATLPVGRPGRRHRARVDRPVHRRREGRRAHRGRREEGHHQRPGQEGGHHDRPRRERGRCTTRPSTTSSATRPAPRTAWRPRPRSSTTTSDRSGAA